ncbi:MAG: hypothetical protein ACOYL1_07005 [Chlamydiia bacterium]
MKGFLGWCCFLSLGALTMSVEPYFEDTNLILEEDILGFNGQPYGLQLSVFEKSLLQPYFNAIIDVSRGKLFHYGVPKAIFTQTILEGQAGYSIPMNRQDIFRFTPFSGLGVYYQRLQGWDKTASFYIPLGLCIDYHLGSYFTVSSVATLLPQIQTFRQTQDSFFQKIPSSIGFRWEIPLLLSLDPYNYVALSVTPFYQYIPFGAPPFSALLATKTELQQIGLRAGFDAQF